MAFYQGLEFADDPRLNALHRLYIRIFGVPISGLRIRLRRILPEIHGPFQNILDVGCGKGIFSFELAKQFPETAVLGIDVNAEQITINNTIAAKHGLKNLHFEAVDILESRQRAEFDMALTVDNLEHIADDVGALESIRALLKPGGILVCHVPAYERRWIFFGFATNFDAPGHVRPGYRRVDLQEKLERAGFRVDWIKSTYGCLETISNNLSYLITGAEQKNAPLYALAFPFLNLMAWLGRHQDPGDRGAGWLARATKPV